MLLVLPQLKGKLNGIALLVTTPNMPVVDLVINVEKSCFFKPVIVATLLLVVGCYFLHKRARKKYNALITQHNVKDLTKDDESLLFSFESIETATSNFSKYNMLSKGGFGDVYKEMLINGREIAVKRLSKSSGQCAAEFKSEVVLVAKLQHKNLVRLLGFCLEEDKKILVYEFIPYKSLDYFLFDPKK